METGRALDDRAVDAETREAVIEAARRSGLSLAEWLQRVLDDESTDSRGRSTGVGRSGMDTATLARLDRRLGDMERISDHALSALKRDLGRRDDKPGRRGVSDMVAALARELENTDEEARTQVEGKRHGTPGRAPAPRQERSLDEIRGRLDQLLGPRATDSRPPSPARPLAQNRLDETLRKLEARIDAARQTLASRSGPPPSRSAEQREAGHAPVNPRDLLADAIDQIAKRQRDLDDARSAASSADDTRRPDVVPSQAALDALHRDISSIGARTSAAAGPDAAGRVEPVMPAERPAPVSGPTPESLAALRDDIQRMLAEQASQGERDRTRLDTLAQELGALRKALDGHRDGESLAELESQIADLRKAVESASHAAEEAAQNPRLERLEWQINEIAGMMETVAAAGRGSDDIERLEARVTELAEILKAMADAGAVSAREDIARLEDRVTDVAALIEKVAATSADRAGGDIEGLETRIAELASILETMAETGAGQAREDVARLEGRVADVAALVENVAAASAESTARDINRLEEQVSSLAGMVETAVVTVADAARTVQVDRIEKRIESLAAGVAAIASSSPSAEALESIRGEIADIRRDVSARPEIDPDQLEGQIGELARRIDEVAAGDPRPEMLAELEAQVARIAAGIEHNDLSAEAVAGLEMRLADMQSHLAHNETQAIEAARLAAEEAVRELAASHAGDAETNRLIEDLKADLDALRAEASAPDTETEQSLASLNATIASVASRLEDLETRARAAAPASATAPATVASAQEISALAARVHGADDDADDRAADAPALIADRLADTSEERDAPGHGQDETAPEPPVDEARARRADFIAAARRAAQAAAAESRHVAHDDESGDDASSGQERTPGPFGRISRALKGRRKSVLLAAAAIVIALGAIQMFGDIEPDRTSGSGAGAGALSAAPAVETRTVPGRSMAETTPPAQLAARLPTRPAYPVPGGATPLTAPQFGTTTARPATTFAPDPALAFAPAGDVESRFVAPQTGSAADVPVSGNERAIGPSALFEAARDGDATAAYEIATRYADGVRAPRDMAAARVWFEQAAEGGLAVGQYRLGSLYERGIGGPRDLVAAADWYQRAADQGNVNAMHNLAVLYSEGVDGPPDHAKALQWFMAAAEYGVTDSQYNLGVLYARGIGLEPDQVAAYKWFAVAAAAGDTGAAERRDQLAEALPTSDLGRARALAQSWARKPALDEANAVASVWDDASRMTATDRRKLVSSVQSLLAGWGFDPGPADGLEGPRTRRAVIAFQRQTGHPATGKIDPALVSALTQRG